MPETDSENLTFKEIKTERNLVRTQVGIVCQGDPLPNGELNLNTLCYGAKAKIRGKDLKSMTNQHVCE